MAASQQARMLALLKKNKSATNAQFNAMNILRYSARLHDLRREGWIINSERVHDGLWRFTLVGHRDEVNV